MMEAASTFDTSVNFYQTTRHNNQKTAIFKTSRLYAELFFSPGAD
jgi:hypothetical protein